jgi:hypothetical protein
MLGFVNDGPDVITRTILPNTIPAIRSDRYPTSGCRLDRTPSELSSPSIIHEEPNNRAFDYVLLFQ